MSQGKKPILFRAVHTKNKWRKSRHETLANARSIGKRSALALFKGENDYIDIAKHGPPLYVIIWEEKASTGEIIRQSTRGIEGATVEIEDIMRWEVAGGGDQREFESYFCQVATERGGRLSNTTLHTDETRPEVTGQGRWSGTPLDMNSGVDMFIEGRLVTKTHLQRERDPRLRGRLLADRRVKGAVSCDVCGRQPVGCEPEISESIFEAHHLIPLSVGSEREVKLTDLALLCACCHRLIHRAMEIKGSWLSLEKAKELWGDIY